MSTANPERVLVVGAGTMGAGIAQVCAQRGRQVWLADVAVQQLARAQRDMAASLAKLEAKGRIHDSASAVLSRVSTADSAWPAEADVVIEAVPEDLALKRRILGQAAERFPASTLLASNTSGIPISELGRDLQAPERFLGLHFFNPAVLMRVVEVVRGAATSDASFQRALDWVASIGKQALPVRQDLAGFVLNRISMVASNEAMRLVQQGVATAQEVDAGVKGAFGWKMGPLETADLVGLDVVLAARSQIHQLTGERRFQPPAILARLVAQGRLGRKTGAGFYDYESGKKED